MCFRKCSQFLVYSVSLNSCPDIAIRRIKHLSRIECLSHHLPWKINCPLITLVKCLFLRHLQNCLLPAWQVHNGFLTSFKDVTCTVPGEVEHPTTDLQSTMNSIMEGVEYHRCRYFLTPKQSTNMCWKGLISRDENGHAQERSFQHFLQHVHIPFPWSHHTYPLTSLLGFCCSTVANSG